MEQMGEESKPSVWISTLPLLESKCDLIQTSYDSHFLSLSPHLQSVAERAVSLWYRSHSIQTAEFISFRSSWVSFCLRNKVEHLIMYTVLMLIALFDLKIPVRHVLSQKHAWNLKKNLCPLTKAIAQSWRCILNAVHWLLTVWVKSEFAYYKIQNMKILFI